MEPITTATGEVYQVSGVAGRNCFNMYNEVDGQPHVLYKQVRSQVAPTSKHVT